VGGVESFAQSLKDGFHSLGLSASVLPPSAIFSRIRLLRDPSVLKILSTTAVFAVPLARRAICIAHGVPCAAFQGWRRAALIALSFRLASHSSGSQLIAVSEYTASHVHAVFGVPVDGVVLNPVRNVYLAPPDPPCGQRDLITYTGRLTRQKGLAELLPILRVLLDERPGFRVCIVGEGPEKGRLMRLVSGDARFDFLGNISNEALRDVFARTKLFFSGNKVEGLGITYLEALSQGCIVAMPAGGGGLEIALDRLGRQVHLLPLSFHREQSLTALRTALDCQPQPISMESFSSTAVASAYLAIDARFDPAGRYHRAAANPA
jgi:glycosyltransferase involved in cell wall biosynthesis